METSAGKACHIWSEGYRAAMSGRSRSDNPYTCTFATAWFTGWQDAIAEHSADTDGEPDDES
jgi:ribosome modulation factor